MRFPAAMILLVLAAVVSPGANAARDCAVPALAGVWENPNAGRGQDVTRIEITHICEKGNTGSRAALPGAIWAVRVFSKCAPRDCKWGRERGEIDADGRLLVTFQTFSARRTVVIAPGGETIYADINIDYYAENVADRKETVVLVAAR